MTGFTGWLRQAWVAALMVLGCAANPAAAEEFDSIVEIMQLREGMVVADVGAGDGDWTAQLAREVGAAGHVWATEVDADEIESIKTRIDDQGLENVTIVEGDQSGTGLPESCCDAILLRLVYHHFERPAEMRTSLLRALRPGGVIAIIDIKPQTAWGDLPDVPDRGGHGIPPEELIREMTSNGLEVLTRRDRWNGDEDRFCIVFRR